jgi:hypothetical protein
MQATGRWGSRASDHAGARDMAMDATTWKPSNRMSSSPKDFWSYQASETTPHVSELPEGTFKGTQQEFEQLSPGMRREIARQAKRSAKDMATDPPVSEPQRKAMFAAAEGKSTLGISKKVGEEFVGKAKDGRWGGRTR